MNNADIGKKAAFLCEKKFLVISLLEKKANWAIEIWMGDEECLTHFDSRKNVW